MTKPAKSLINALQDDAQERAREAEKRLLYVAQKGAGWKILEFFVQNTAAWGSLWYFLVSFIGVTYSWGFYQQLDIDIFSFFDTPDFLLNAFQNTAVLITGVLVTFIGIGILVYSVYNSSLYSAYDFQRDVQRYRVGVRREALLLGWLTLAFFAVSLFSWWQLPQVSPKAVLYLISGVSCGILAFFVLSAYRFLIRKHASNLDRRDDRFLRDERILLFIILIEATFIIPFLLGGVESYAAREEVSRSVKVTLSQDRPKTPLPDRTLFLGTTSRFHFFYECENSLKTGNDSTDKNKTLKKGDAQKDEKGTSPKVSLWDTSRNWILGWWNTQKASAPECENGRPFIIPTTNIVSLEFKPREDSRNGEPRNGEKTEDGSSDAVTAIKTHDVNSKKNKEEIIKAIKDLKPGDVSPPDSGEIATAIKTLNETVHNLPISVGENSCDSGWKTVGIIGPFSEGEHSQLGKIKGECLGQPEIDPQACSDQLASLDKFVTMDQFSFNGETPQHLMLVGRVDDKLFSKEKREFYGTQMELAKARAEWVRGKILKRFPKQIDSQRIILRVAGPRCPGPGVSECDRAKDRSVEVQVCSSKDPGQAGAPANPPG